MADEKAIVAEPSSAQEPQSGDTFTLPVMSTEQRAAWQKDGNLPEPPSTETPAAPDPLKAAKPAAAEPSKTQPKAAPEPGAGKETQENDQRIPKDRFDQVIAERNELRKQLEARGKVEPPKVEAKPEPLAPLSYEKFKSEWIEKNPDGTYDQLGAAWADASADNKLKLFQAEQTKAAAEKAQAEQVEGFKTVWNERAEKAKAKHEDFEAVAYAPEVPIIPGSVVDAFIAESEIGPDILYALAGNYAELNRLQSMPPLKAAKELYALEAKLLENTEAKPAAEPAPPARQVTRVPKPAPVVGGHATAPDDAVASAAATGDFRSFKTAANERDRARFKR